MKTINKCNYISSDKISENNNSFYKTIVQNVLICLKNYINRQKKARFVDIMLANVYLVHPFLKLHLSAFLKWSFILLEINHDIMSTLEEYKELVNKKADDNSPDILPNAGKDHAAIVMAKMFEKTNHTVDMIVGSFDGKVSNQDDYLDNLKKCVEKGVRFNIIFLDSPNNDSKAYNYLKSKKDNGYKISFYQATDEAKERLKKQSNTGDFIHFSVFDEDKFRFEKDTKNYLAWFSFKDELNASALKSTFNTTLNKSITL